MLKFELIRLLEQDEYDPHYTGRYFDIDNPIDITENVMEFDIDELKFFDRATLLLEPRKCSLKIHGIDDLIKSLIVPLRETTQLTAMNHNGEIEYDVDNVGVIKFISPFINSPFTFPSYYDHTHNPVVIKRIPAYDIDLNEQPAQSYDVMYKKGGVTFIGLILKITDDEVNNSISLGCSFNGIGELEGITPGDDGYSISFIDWTGVLFHCMEKFGSLQSFNLDIEMVTGIKFNEIGIMAQSLISNMYSQLVNMINYNDFPQSSVTQENTDLFFGYPNDATDVDNFFSPISFPCSSGPGIYEPTFSDILIKKLSSITDTYLQYSIKGFIRFHAHYGTYPDYFKRITALVTVYPDNASSSTTVLSSIVGSTINYDGEYEVNINTLISDGYQLLYHQIYQNGYSNGNVGPYEINEQMNGKNIKINILFGQRIFFTNGLNIGITIEESIANLLYSRCNESGFNEEISMLDAFKTFLLSQGRVLYVDKPNGFIGIFSSKNFSPYIGMTSIFPDDIEDLEHSFEVIDPIDVTCFECISNWENLKLKDLAKSLFLIDNKKYGERFSLTIPRKSCYMSFTIGSIINFLNMFDEQIEVFVDSCKYDYEEIKVEGLKL